MRAFSIPVNEIRADQHVKESPIRERVAGLPPSAASEKSVMSAMVVRLRSGYNNQSQDAINDLLYQLESTITVLTAF